MIRIKENEEAVIKTVKEAETVESFTPLLEDIFTETLQLAKSKYSVLPLYSYCGCTLFIGHSRNHSCLRNHCITT